ncbi:MAG TPA: SgcJ/EcaC family oxidoreductase [Candidatus Dormibacteraeota bacterium]|nr:SgcJ/EcaC family oxidoreductase [Candidatus Dormibacteraeota bacterium]
MTRSASLAVVLALSAGAAADPPPLPRAEVEQFVRAYVEANNAADPAAVMDLMSRRPDVSSVTMGAVARGPEAIRRETGTLAGFQGSHRMLLAGMDVVPLGPGYALVVAQVTFELAAEGLNSDLHGAVTLVVEKSSGKWKVLHEHVSLQFPLSDVQGGSSE